MADIKIEIDKAIADALAPLTKAMDNTRRGLSLAKRAILAMLVMQAVTLVLLIGAVAFVAIELSN